ncbi:hypothetical protein FB45DRAFT_1005170 [Roridomyces roridus]|uniref:F-box domain-containing protein n=1 Tax=Roridomyces roridus TaxID=1738132 RepID=A0AAD7FIB3_9AGAR|nr:hypothetical protein FB45DRAFT_1005170 [Roridomyces roridus]
MAYEHPPFTPSSFINKPSFSAEIQRLSRENSALPTHLAASVGQVSADVSRYGEEIARLCALVEQLKQNKASLEALHTSMQSLIPSVAPIRRLPSELLLSIFQHWIMERGSWSSRFSPSDRVPFDDMRTLAHVCFRWYRLILDTPTLWTQIYLEALFAKPPDVVAKALAMALKRSMDAPLDFEVHDDLGHEREVLGEPLRVLATASHRWRSATFHGSAMPGDIFQRVPRLERLSIRASKPSLRARWIDAVKVADMPRLQYLVLAGPFDISGLRLENLRETTLESVDSSSLNTLLPSVARITGQLSLTLVPDGIPDLPSITSNIDRLSLGFETDSTTLAVLGSLMRPIFNNVTLPRLSGLSLSVGEYPRIVLPWRSATADAFLRCAARSGFADNLQALDIREVGLKAKQLPALLAALPALTELGVADPGVDDSEISVFGDDLLANLGAEESSLVPRLWKLTYVSNLSFNEPLFMEFLRSRARSQPTAAKFKLHLRWFTEQLSVQETFMMEIVGPRLSMEYKLMDLEKESGGKLKVECVMFSHRNQSSRPNR